MINTFNKAIGLLLGDKSASYTSENNKILEWNPVESGLAQPTEAEIDAKMVELQAEWDALAYARNRRAEYDALNQFELISDDANNGTTTHIDAVNAIKTKYPKP